MSWRRQQREAGTRDLTGEGEQVDDTAAPLPGTLIAQRFRVIEELARGGMGVVLRVLDTNLDRQVAVKIIAKQLAVDPFYRTHFAAEARAMARVRSPRVVEILEYGDWQDAPYLVMPLLRGQSLRRWVRDRGGAPVETDLALHILDQVCEGVAAIHEVELAHNDIKPENIVIDDELNVVVADLGLACASSGDFLNMGTPVFTAPERILGSVSSTHDAQLADIYSMGVLAGWLLTGRYPSAEEPAPSEERPLSGEVRPLNQRLTAVLAAAIDPNPETRLAGLETLRTGIRIAAAQLARGPAERELRIVVVDDDPDLVAWVQAVLAGALPAAVVQTFHDGDLALAAIRQSAPDILLTDLQMPGLGGQGLTAAVRAEGSADATAIVVMTAVGGAPDWQVLRDLGADAFVAKPIDERLLIDLCRRFAEPDSRTKS